MARRLATDDQEKQLARGEKIPHVIPCNWHEADAKCYYKKKICSLWQIWSDLRTAGAGTDTARLSVRFHEEPSPTSADQRFNKNGNAVVFPYNVPVLSGAGLKITSCAGFMDPQANDISQHRCKHQDSIDAIDFFVIQAWVGKYTCILFLAEIDASTNALAPKKPLVIVKEAVPCQV